jgi:1,2-dihydroxy-3-keto-5-methylthiopentene dioxygenase
MARVTLRDSGRTLTDPDEIRSFLARYGLWYRRSDQAVELGDDVAAEQVLAAYDEPIRALSAEGGYTTADVVDIHPDTPGLGEMLAKFEKEHTHSEDEVRFIVAGRGLFHVNPEGMDVEGTSDGVFAIEVEAGDMINVPRGTRHWFHVCPERRVRAIRLFQDKAGWTPHYLDDNVDPLYQPLCFSEWRSAEGQQA